MPGLRDYSQRGSRRTKRVNNIFLIICEGKETEKQYFNCFRNELRRSNFEIIALPAKHRDAISIVNRAIEEIKYRELDIGYGDQVWCVFDRDINKNPELIEAKIEAQKCGINIAFSNPCFEVWYICHYIRSSASLDDGDKAKRFLQNYIPNYHESLCVYHKIKPLQTTAFNNAKYLKEEHARFGNILYSIKSDPSTNVDELVKALNDL